MVSPLNMPNRPTYQFTLAGLLSHDKQVCLAALKEVREMVEHGRPCGPSQMDYKMEVLKRIDAMIAKEEGK